MKASSAAATWMISRTRRTETPVILTTSQMLTTGVDAPTCRNIVLFKPISSMVDFKQIIGRGTRVLEENDKYWFTIIDYVGRRNYFMIRPSMATRCV